MLESIIIDIDIGSTLEGLERVNLIYYDVVIVGQNPSSKPSKNNTTFFRLNKWIEYLGIDSFFFMNASSKVGSIKQSDVCLDNLRKACYNASRIIALGNFASEALTNAGIEHFKLPHPSPLNRMINNEKLIKSKLDACIEYLNPK